MISQPILLEMKLHRAHSFSVCIVGDFSVVGYPEASWKSLELPLFGPVSGGSLQQLDTNGDSTGRGTGTSYSTNVPGKCCIPANTNGDKYRVTLQWSNKHGRLLPHVLNVPGREAIEMHSASRPSDLLGCVAIGTTWVERNPLDPGDVVISGSQLAFYTQFQPIYLKIVGLAPDQVTTERARLMSPVDIGTLEISNDFLLPPA